MRGSSTLGIIFPDCNIEVPPLDVEVPLIALSFLSDTIRIISSRAYKQNIWQWMQSTDWETLKCESHNVFVCVCMAMAAIVLHL